MAVDLPPMSLDQALSLHERPAYVQVADASTSQSYMANQNFAQRARTQALIETALGIGVKTGIAHQLDKIREQIKLKERELDTVYDFGGLMIQDMVVPPVIIEARDLYNQDGDRTLRLSGAYYKIESQAKFSSVAPNWRGYLSFPKTSPVQDGFDVMSPKTSQERGLWQDAIKNGYNQGVEQANVMLEYAFDRLNRDFTGMLRFHEFVAQGKITMPIIATENIPITNNGSTMTVDETLLRITTLSNFQGDMTKWIGLPVTNEAKGKPEKPWIKSSVVQTTQQTITPQSSPGQNAQSYPVSKQ